jgi:hypothetical protein
VAVLLGGALALSACALDHSAKVGLIDPHDFGEANRQTYAAMIIDPNPQYATPMAGNGQHAAAAIERYRKGEVKQPERVSSTTSSAGGSAGGSGSGK